MPDSRPPVLECVVNVSEGRDDDLVVSIAGAAGSCLLDVHSDRHHNRSVLTIAGEPGDVEAAARSVARVSVAKLDVRSHRGVHPRVGVVDVVPFVNLQGRPLADGPIRPAAVARDAFAAWAGRDLGLPCYLYGPERSLPELRRALRSQAPPHPDCGPILAHPKAGFAAVGARPVLIAYNLWLGRSAETRDLGATARDVASSIRGPDVRSLGFVVGDGAQVSCNLIAPWRVGPGAVFDAVASRVGVERAELVGLVPLGVLEAEPRHRWDELGLAPSRTIEARLEQAGLDGGRFR
jgi:glutamate formiminotransferase / 5-formyltetrahydrofolate cyclo-ligase